MVLRWLSGQALPRGGVRALVLAVLVRLGTVGAAAGCIGGGDGGDGVPEGRWEEAFDTSETGALFGVWGSGPDDVFIVGGTEEQAEIYHFDGDQWSPMEAPEVPLLIWVFGFGPDDVYSVGLGGSVIHYDGDAWRALDSGTEVDLWGIFGFEPDEMWIVGGDPFDSEGTPALFRFDGEELEEIGVDDAENPRGAHALFKVWGIDDALFCVGQRGAIIGRDGERWVDNPAGAEADQDFVSLWGTSDTNIVAVGGRSNAKIATYDGEAWTTRSPTGLGGLNAVNMVESERAIIAGVEGFVGRYEVTLDKVVEEEQSVTTLDIHAVWGDGAGRHYAVAGEFLPPFQGAALVRSTL